MTMPRRAGMGWRGTIPCVDGSEDCLRGALASSLQTFVKANRDHFDTNAIVQVASLHLVDAMRHLACIEETPVPSAAFAIWLRDLGLLVSQGVFWSPTDVEPGTVVYEPASSSPMPLGLLGALRRWMPGRRACGAASQQGSRRR